MSFPNNVFMPKSITGPMNGNASITNAYWIPGNEFNQQSFIVPFDHQLGFSISKPWPLPTLSTIYNGSGAVPGVQQMVLTQFTDSRAISNRVPMFATKPLIDPDQLRFRRENYIYR